MIYRLHSGYNFRSGFDIGNDFVDGLIGKGRFIQCSLGDAGGVNTLHGVIVCLARRKGDEMMNYPNYPQNADVLSPAARIFPAFRRPLGIDERPDQE